MFRDRIKLNFSTFLVVLAFVPCRLLSAASITGPWDEPSALKKWHKITITFDGPNTSESANPNPFTDYRLNIAFTRPDKSTLLVPGYYCADGDAGNTSAASGNKWRAHLAPDQVGTWSYVASFRTGSDVAVSDDPDAGTATAFDGESGILTIQPSDKIAPDPRAAGRLDYVGRHHLQFAETGQYFLKCGADAPENFLAYADFDGNFKSDGRKDNLVKTWSAHIGDWHRGDPVWQLSKGKGIIGAINYLASKGMNAFSFLTLNINGDDRNVFMYTTYNERERFDVSRLDQWEIVLEHGDRMGMYLHFKTQETENELLLDNGDMGVQRKLYYRELIARFSHHLALNWNLGEEINDASHEQKVAWADYFWTHDPYRHHIVIHNGANHYDLLGSASKLTGFSLQTNQTDFSRVFSQTKNYIDRSVAAGKPWVVACDEPGDASHALVPDWDDPGHDNARKNGLWGNIMAGGAGLEWYFGYQHDHSDLTCQDWRSRDAFWDQCRCALQFFANNDIPFWDTHNANQLITSTDAYCLAKAGDVYVVYLKNGGTTNINLPEGDYTVGWYNPRTGGQLLDGALNAVSGPGLVSVGTPPCDPLLDWVVLVRAVTTVPADFDRDHDVDAADLTRLSEDWLRCNDPADTGCEDVLAGSSVRPLGAALAAAAPLIGPVTSVSAGTNGNPPYILQSVTIGGYTVTVDNLRTGTSAGVADVAGHITNADDFDLNNIAARNNPSNALWTITMIGGQSSWVDTNGDLPDFFIFEAGMNDDIEVQAILPRGVLGQKLNISKSNWGDTGLNRKGSPNDGQDIGGLAFAITDLKNASGAPLANSSVIEGIRVTSGTLDPSCFCAVQSLDNQPPQVNAGEDQAAFLVESLLAFQLDGTVSDDGKPEPPVLTAVWSVEDNPDGSSVTFDPSAASEDPIVVVDTVGEYVLRLTANDGPASNYDELTVTAVEASCRYVRENGLLLETDLTGPGGEPDCRINMYDLADLALYWLAQ